MDPGAALTETVRSLTARLAAVEAKVGIETAASGAGAGAGAGTAAPPAVYVALCCVHWSHLC